MTMVERVARALCIADGKDPNVDWRVGEQAMLSVAVEHPENWRQYVKKARAAIEAMREPSNRMMAAVEDPGDPTSEGQTGLSSRDAANIWHEMIDAALEEAGERH